MSLEIPRIEVWQFGSPRGMKHLKEQVEGLLYGEIPMLHFPAAQRIDVDNPPLKRRDIRMVGICLGQLGFKYTYQHIRLYVKDTTKPDKVPMNKEGWHIDEVQTPGFEGAYPNQPTMTLRRHTVISSPAEVKGRITRVAHDAPSGFEHDPGAPTYQAIQQPGDSMYFVSLGGIVGKKIIPQCEHSFQSMIQTKTRLIHVGEFEFNPVNTNAL